VGPIAYLSDSRAVISTLEGAMCLLDIDKMQVLGPLRLGAHELRRYEDHDVHWAGAPPKGFSAEQGIREWAGDLTQLFTDDRGSVYSWHHNNSLVAWPDGAFGPFACLTQ
jgi:hypothetical protein